MSTDIRLKHLRAYSPNATEEGQDYWTLTLVDLIDVFSTEVAHSPKVRGLNPTTGEIVEGPLLVILGHMMYWADEGQDFRIEPLENQP